MPPRGRGWEVQLEELHRRYRRDRLATILRASQPTKVFETLPGGRFVGCFAADGPPDFQGALQGGLAVAFDAKDVQSPRFPFAQLARHQAMDLEAWHDRGGIAFVALRCLGEAFVLPWAELGPRWWAWNQGESGVASTKREDWWRPFEVHADGWLPRVQPVAARKAS